MPISTTPRAADGLVHVLHVVLTKYGIDQIDQASKAIDTFAIADVNGDMTNRSQRLEQSDHCSIIGRHCEISDTNET